MLLLAREPSMTANHVGESAVIHPVVLVRVDEYKISSTSEQWCESFLSLLDLREIG